MKKLTVETPYGAVTRTSARPYAFVVVSFGQSESYLRSQHAANVAHQEGQARTYRKAADDGGVLYPWATASDTVETCGQTPEQFIEWAEQAELFAARPFVMADAALVLQGWSQSREGAQRMADEAARHGHLGIAVVAVTPAELFNTGLPVAVAEAAIPGFAAGVVGERTPLTDLAEDR